MEVDLEYKIGKLIKFGRKKRGWSQDDLAEKLGEDVTRSMVSTWELGHVIPRANDFLKLGEILDEMHELFPTNSTKAKTTAPAPEPATPCQCSEADYTPVVSCFSDALGLSEKLTMIQQLSHLVRDGQIDGGAKKLAITALKVFSQSLQDDT